VLDIGATPLPRKPRGRGGVSRFVSHRTASGRDGRQDDFRSNSIGRRDVKRFLLFLLAAIAGLTGGALLGVGIGLGYTTAFNTTGFEGYAGYLVFMTFMPIGALVGMFVAPFLVARKLGHRNEPETPAG